MATYIPNATQTTEPVESRTVESAALEFRTLKASVNSRVATVQSNLDAETTARIAGDANLQAQNNSQDVRLTAIENALPFIGEGGLPGTVYVQRLSGTGAQTVFTLNAAPQSNNVVDIYINGIYQNKDTFTVSGADVIFSEAPPAGTNNIEVQVTATIALGETDASLVTYDGTTVEAQLDAISAVSGSSLVGFQQAGTGAVVRTAQDKMREVVSVKDFGADPTGVVDSTAAFNLATMASAVHGGNDDLAMRRMIYVPPGDYRIDGTVYVRKGQMLRGAGDGATRILPPAHVPPDPSTFKSTFKLGFGIPGGVETEDPGGLPPVIEKLHTMGSHQNGCVVDMHVSGAQARDLFITSCSVGISLGGGDTIISNIIFDQGGDGMRVTGQNHIIDSCLFFLMDTGIRVLDNSFDVQINNCHFEYSLADDITFTHAATQIKNVSIQNCQFLKNAQYAESNQAIYILSSGADIFVHGCEFRNQRSYSIAIRTGLGNNLRVSNCVFDGNKTNPVYFQGTTAAGVLVQNGYVEITNCRFENLYGDPITINGIYDYPVTVKGCSYRNISNATSFVNIAAAIGDVTITDCVGDGVLPLINLQSNIRPHLKNNSRWLGAAGNSGGRFFWKIPTTGAANVQVGIVANTLPGGSAGYRQASVFFASRYIDRSGVAITDYATGSTIYATPGGTAPAVDARVELDAVGGGTSGTYSGQGRYLVVSVPNTYAVTEIEAEFMV